MKAVDSTMLLLIKKAKNKVKILISENRFGLSQSGFY